MAIYNGDKNEVTFKCVGVNHQAFYTVFEHNGEDLYTKLREQLKNEKFYEIMTTSKLMVCTAPRSGLYRLNY